MEIKCYKCGHKWNYSGSAIMATCPSCMRKIKNEPFKDLNKILCKKSIKLLMGNLE